jgi:hypothetical protein
MRWAVRVAHASQVHFCSRSNCRIGSSVSGKGNIRSCDRKPREWFKLFCEHQIAANWDIPL